MQGSFPKHDISGDYKSYGLGSVNFINQEAFFYPMNSVFEAKLKRIASNQKLYLFHVESNLKKTSKRREYLGAFGLRSIKLEDSSSEIELFASDTMSVYAGIRQIDKKYFSECDLPHKEFLRNFFMVSELPPTDLILECSNFVSLNRSFIRIEYEKVLKLLSTRTLVKFWRDKNDVPGYIVIGKWSNLLMNCE